MEFLRGQMNKLETVIDNLAPEHRVPCLKLYYDNYDIFATCPGSSHNHQTWVGGYIDHMCAISEIAKTIYASLSQIRPLPFKLEDALLCLFLHDLEKPWKYAGLKHFTSDEERLTFVREKATEYGIDWTEERWNAVKYTHGEGEDYRSDVRVQTPLAAFVHCCDVMSARIWFDKGASENYFNPYPGVPACNYCGGAGHLHPACPTYSACGVRK